MPGMFTVDSSRDGLKSSTYKVTFKWQVKASYSFLGDCHSPKLGLASGIGAPVSEGPVGGIRPPQKRPNSSANVAQRTPRLCLSANSLTLEACLHY